MACVLMKCVLKCALTTGPTLLHRVRSAAAARLQFLSPIPLLQTATVKERSTTAACRRHFSASSSKGMRAKETSHPGAQPPQRSRQRLRYESDENQIARPPAARRSDVAAA